MPKNVLKADIRLMLNKLTTFIDGGDNKYYQGLVSSIYNELDTLNVVDLYATREYISDNLNKIIASKAIEAADANAQVEEDLSTKKFKVKLQKDANSTPVELYSGDEAGAKEVAEKLKESGLIGNVIVAAEEDEVPEDTEAADFNDIPAEKAANDAAEDKAAAESEAPEESDDGELLTSYDEAIDSANKLLDMIDNAIIEVVDLSAATELGQVKDDLENKIAELQDYNIEGGDFDPSEVEDKIANLNDYLKDNEEEASNIINASMPGQKDTEVATKAYDKFNEPNKEPAEGSVVVADENEKDEADETPEADTTAPNEFDEDLPAAEDNTPAAEDTDTDELTNFDAPSADAPSAEDVSDALDAAPEADEAPVDSEETVADDAETLEDLLNRLTELVDVPGENAKEFADTVTKIEDKAANEPAPEPVDDSDVESNLDDANFDDIDKDIEDNIMPENEALPPQELVDIDTDNEDKAPSEPTEDSIPESLPKADDDDVNVIEEKDDDDASVSGKILASKKLAQDEKPLMAEDDKKKLVSHAVRVAVKNDSNEEDITKDMKAFCASKFADKNYDDAIDACLSEVLTRVESRKNKK